MLTEERHAIILNLVNRQKSAELNELCGLLDASESTVRRDLSILSGKGMLVKVRGGAIAIDESFALFEQNVDEKSALFVAEKEAIARYAVSLVDDGDFIFLDAGTTTEKMIEYLPSKQVTFVTNAFVHAKKLAQRGFKVFLPAGEIKLATEAIIGTGCVTSLDQYNFSKCFMGTNGVSITGGYSTPDPNEACVKAAAIKNSRMPYILADHSKFDKVSSVKFAHINKCRIITDKLDDKKYLMETTVKETM